MKLIDGMTAVFLIIVAGLFVYKWFTAPWLMALCTSGATVLALLIYHFYFLLFPEAAKPGCDFSDSSQ